MAIHGAERVRVYVVLAHAVYLLQGLVRHINEAPPNQGYESAPLYAKSVFGSYLHLT
jgi:hypothetical protein